MSDETGPITLTIGHEKAYIAGFPLLVAVDLRNVSSNVFDSLPRFDLFTVPCPVSFILRGGGHEWKWREMSRPLDDERRGEVWFQPGMSWFALQDLSELHPDIPPGHYELSAEALFSGYVARSAPVRFEIHESSKEDRAIAAKLRATNDDGKPSWRAFIRENWSTPQTHGLSAAAKARLAYYLYLHRAAYGPRAIAALDPAEPGQFGHGVLEAEAAVLRLEILRAAKKAEAAGIEAAILERWPGLLWRVEAIHRGWGLLTSLRSEYGVEQDHPPAGKARPYQP